MTLRSRTLLLLAAALFILVWAIFFSIQNLLHEGIYKEEEKSVRSNLDRSERALAHEIQAMEAVTADYAKWNGTADFMENKTPGFIEDNLVDSTFFDLRFNVMAFYDKDGHLVFGKGYDLLQQREIPYPEALGPILKKRGAIVRPDNGSWRFYGLIMLPDSPLCSPGQVIS